MYQHLEIAVDDSNLSVSCIRNHSCTSPDIKTSNSVEFDSKMTTSDCFSKVKTQANANI